MGRQRRSALRDASGARVCVMGGLSACVSSEPRRGPFSPMGTLGPRPPRIGLGPHTSGVYM
eukprot:669180-Alexandrium_andersonii.AAC.1